MFNHKKMNVMMASLLALLLFLVGCSDNNKEVTGE